MPGPSISWLCLIKFEEAYLACCDAFPRFIKKAFAQKIKRISAGCREQVAKWGFRELADGNIIR